MFQISDLPPTFQAFTVQALNSTWRMLVLANQEYEKFTTDVSSYERGRPEYSEESVEFLLNRVDALPFDKQEPMKLLEIAAGTGKFTRGVVWVLAAKKANVEIIVSDSQEVMCDMFRRVVPGIEMLQFNFQQRTLVSIKINVKIGLC